MIIFEYSFYIDKGKEEEYLKWAGEVGVPHWLSIPGVNEIRIYSVKGGNKRKAVIEMESFEAWGKAFDNPRINEVTNKFAEYIHGLEWTLYQEVGRYAA